MRHTSREVRLGGHNILGMILGVGVPVPTVALRQHNFQPPGRKLGASRMRGAPASV